MSVAKLSRFFTVRKTANTTSVFGSKINDTGKKKWQQHVQPPSTLTLTDLKQRRCLAQIFVHVMTAYHVLPVQRARAWGHIRIPLQMLVV
eukprot:3887605-Amphidinium_carterae.1